MTWTKRTSCRQQSTTTPSWTERRMAGLLATIVLLICALVESWNKMMARFQKSTTLHQKCYTSRLGLEIHSEFRGIPQLIQFWTFWTPEFSSEFIFTIIKCVPVDSEHISSGSESSPAISSSDFMNQKMFLPSVFIWPAKTISSRISQQVDTLMLICVDVGTIPGKAILSTIIYHLLNLDRNDFCRQNNHAAKITSTHFVYFRC